MRTARSLAIIAVATAIVSTALTLFGPHPVVSGVGDGGPDTNQVIREGQIVEITDTTVSVREWAGVYTYRLTPSGLKSLEANNIRVGDKVQFNAYSVWQIAYYFRKL